MAQENRFCTNCGTPLIPGGKFCGSCGSQVGAIPTPPVAPPNQVVLTPPKPPASSVEKPIAAVITPPIMPPDQVLSPPNPPSASTETLIGVIPNVNRKKNLFTFEAFNIIVTPRRMIFAALTTDMIKDAAKEARSGGFLAGVMGSLTAGLTYYKRYYNISPDAALAENPQNFCIEMSSIKKLKLEIGRLRSEANNITNKYDDSRLEIQTVGEKLIFTIPNSFHEEARAIIRKAGLV